MAPRGYLLVDCWYILLPYYHHYAELLKSMKGVKCLLGSFYRMDV